MDTDRAAGDLNAVDDGVVRLRADPAEQAAITRFDSLFELLKVLIHRRGERVVRRIVVMFRVVVFEKRKVDHDQWFEDILRDQLFAFCDLDAKRSKTGSNYGLSSCNDQN